MIFNILPVNYIFFMVYDFFMELLEIGIIRKIFSLQYPMFVLVLFELPTFCLHSFIRNWVVLNKEDDESFFSLPLLLCFGKMAYMFLIKLFLFRLIFIVYPVTSIFTIFSQSPPLQSGLYLFRSNFCKIIFSLSPFCFNHKSGFISRNHDISS